MNRQDSKIPVCECNNFQCDVSLGIDWNRYEIEHPFGVLISDKCICRSAPEGEFVVNYGSFKIYKINQ